LILTAEVGSRFPEGDPNNERPHCYTPFGEGDVREEGRRDGI